MTDYVHDQVLLADAASFTRAPNSSVTVYDANDASNSTPLTLKDLNGLVMPNPMVSSSDAFTPAFVTTSAQVKLVGGGLAVLSESYKGVRDEAIAAKSAAEESLQAAQDAAALVGSPADAAIAAAISGTNSSTRTAVNLAILDKIKTDSVPKWKSNTVYLAGDKVVSPSGDVVSAKANFTSGASFSSANWNYTPTFAPVPQAVKNPLTGYYHVRGFGGKGDTTTTNDTVVNALIAQVIAAGGGTVYFDDDPFYTNPVYRIDQMVIYGQGDVNLEIKAAPNVSIKPAPLSTTDFITISSGATSSSQPFIRRVKFTDLAIQAQGYGPDGTKINRRGIVISQAQDIRFTNVKIHGFKQGALVLNDCWDSYFNDVEVKRSGYGTDNSTYAHALQFLGTYDNSNNNRFVNLHMEFCPLMMLFNNDSRLNVFANYKLEDGSETEKNLSTISPIYFKQALENTFSNGFITVGYTSDVPFITTDNNSASYSSTFNVRQSAKFSNSFFTANSMNKARWFSGYNTDFDNVTVNRANGASTAYVFDFISRCTLRGGSITMADNGSNVFRTQLDGNIIETVNITTSGDGAAASTSGFTLSSGATRTLIRDYTITGSMGVEFIAGSTLVNSGNLGSNSVTNKRGNTLTASGGGQKSVLYKDYIKLTDASAATYTGFTYGCQGQKITVFATTANVTLQHGATPNAIAMKSGANVTLSALETRSFVNIDGVWREI